MPARIESVDVASLAAKRWSMGFFDWLRPKPPRFANAIARELSLVVFGLHPSARDRIEITLHQGRIVAMDVPDGDVSGALGAAAPGERGVAIARAAELVAELRTKSSVQGDRLTVMRDRVIWMPSVIPFSPVSS